MRSLYQRLGRRYLDTVLVLAFSSFYLVYLLGLAGLTIYVDMSGAEFLRLVVMVILVQGVYVVWMPTLIRRRLRPVLRWLDGARDPEAVSAAWRAASVVPVQWLREVPRRGLPLPGFIVSALYMAWELDLPALSLLHLLLAIAVVTLYGLAVVFFTLELAMRPLLEDLGGELADVMQPVPVELPLRTRLLVTLTAISIGSGVTTAALSPKGSVDLSDLSLTILVGTAVALTFSMLEGVLLVDSIATPLRDLRLGTERVGAGDLAARVPVTTSDETGELVRSFNRMAAGLEERQRLHQAFGMFVDPDLAERVLREGTDLAGEEVELSVLFLDVRGFTSLSERTSAREVVALLNDLYEKVVPIVLRHGGHANKFIGDGMLAIFGAPDRQPDHAERAVRAAIEIADVVRDCYHGELRVGVGVNSGRVVVGTIGGGGRLDFTVIGDPVNTAARVESATRATDDDVLISGATYRQLADADDFEPRPALPLKGKSETVALFAPRSTAGVGREGPEDSQETL